MSIHIDKLNQERGNYYFKLSEEENKLKTEVVENNQPKETYSATTKRGHRGTVYHHATQFMRRMKE
jgi:hypothetical protein